MHHTIEEQTLFPILGKRMPQFSERESRGEHIESHRQIHDGEPLHITLADANHLEEHVFLTMILRPRSGHPIRTDAEVDR